MSKKSVPVYLGVGPDRVLLGYGEIEQTDKGIVMTGAMHSMTEAWIESGLGDIPPVSLGFEPNKLNEDPAVRQGYRYGEQARYLMKHGSLQSMLDQSQAWDHFRRQFINTPERWSDIVDAYLEARRVKED